MLARVIVASILWGLLALGALAQTQAEKGAALARAIASIQADDWTAAAGHIRAANDSAATSYFDWRRLRAGEADWAAYPAFLASHRDWPGLPLLRRIGEQQIPDGRPNAEILAYFRDDAPQTGIGLLRYAAALDAAGQNPRPALRTGWLELDLSEGEQANLLARWGTALKPHHWARTDELIWRGDLTQATRMFPLLDAGRRKLAEARIALRRGQSGVTALIQAVPGGLARDPGLRYDRFVWRMRRDLYSGGEELLLEASVSRDALGNPEAWSRRRAFLVRNAVRAGRYTAAYRLASRHRLEQEEDGFRDLEWLSGWIALRFLGRPDAAITHFRALRPLAITPITAGRVWYWLGRAHEAAGNAAKAEEGYALAARYQTSFYGQLGRAAIGEAPAAALAGRDRAEWQGAPFLASTVFRAGLLLHYAGERYEGGRFFAHQAETMTELEQAQLGQLLIDLGRPNMSLRVAKNAARLGRMILPPYYPVIEAPVQDGVPQELTLAIMRQETELNPAVTSPVGARGLMQLMPATAREMARATGQIYSASRLLSDPVYNASLGNAYLGKLLKNYDGSYILTAVAYNAGPGRVSQWIAQNGDPRRSNVDPIDWIEKISFNETRNYVMRVIEGVGVYRARLTGDPSAVRIEQDLGLRR